MFLSKLIIKLYTVLIEIGLWFMLLAGAVAGWAAGGFFGAIGGLISAAIFGALFFGIFLIINDIRIKVGIISQTQAVSPQEHKVQVNSGSSSSLKSKQTNESNVQAHL